MSSVQLGFSEAMVEVAASEADVGMACQTVQSHLSSLLDQVSLGLGMSTEHHARAQELGSREERLNQRLREVELKEKQLDSLHRRLERREKKVEELKPRVKTEEDQSITNMDCRELLVFMNEQFRRIDLAGSRMSAVLQASPDPGKVVLEGVRGFYPLNRDVDGRETEMSLRCMRKSCVLLLQELKRMTSPQISAPVREEAKKLAAEWKAKMKEGSENSWQAKGLLRLIAAYGLDGVCDAEELQSLVAMVEQPEQSSELRRTLGLTDEAPGTNANSSIVKIEGRESPLARNAATLSSPNHSLPNDMLVSLKSSSDKAKLVLKLIKRSLTQYWTNGDVSSKETVVSSNISLLNFLMGASAHVGPHLKDAATNLAAQWKANMTADTENSLENLGFSLFIAIYGLLSTLNEDEIVKLLGKISQHKQSLELCQTHGFADKIAGLIGKLIEMKQVIDAVRSICLFKLIDKFPPVPLLKAYVQDAKEWSELVCSLKISDAEKEKAVNGKIADLRAVIQCIKDCNLASEYPSMTVEMQIDQLQILEENWRPSCVSKVKQQERKRKRPNIRWCMYLADL
ncbi:FRIGIDA-like protein 1 isoform X2 [Rosa rugosa]|uniref:FRIGIDA-like protein 1 isoform X2 n=1 Tax=Rosa rugosa TaxID=74645 RepID=UPI002B405F73|nr:FRIGIDA-like protein 1 isoform X2 [Rosa rugosa]XP_062026787.1 FRIGIDA-like protein 1 isoform X2 [Rosa rugosa]